MRVRVLVVLLAGALAVPGYADASHDPAAEVRTVKLLPLPAVAGGAPSSALGRRYEWIVPRARKDRPGSGGGRRVHIVYVTTTDRPAPDLDRRGVLDMSLRAINRWMVKKTGRKWRLDTFRFRPGVRRNGRVVRLARRSAVDVTFVRSGRRSASMDSVSDVADLLRARGFHRPDRRYLAFVAGDAGGVCGEAEYPLSPSSGPVGQYAAVFLYSDRGCGTRAFAKQVTRPSWSEAATLHEFLHNDGVAPLTSPHTCAESPGHICTAGLAHTDLDPEMADLLFPFVTGPLTKKVLDRGRDDYFDHPWPHRDLRNSGYLRRA